MKHIKFWIALAAIIVLSITLSVWLSPKRVHQVMYMHLGNKPCKWNGPGTTDCYPDGTHHKHAPRLTYKMQDGTHAYQGDDGWWYWFSDIDIPDSADHDYWVTKTSPVETQSQNRIVAQYQEEEEVEEAFDAPSAETEDKQQQMQDNEPDNSEPVESAPAAPAAESAPDASSSDSGGDGGGGDSD